MKQKVMSQNNIAENLSNNEDSDISDFEQKVEANRAIINKRKKEKSISTKPKPKDKKGNNLYDKRIKEYRDFS